MLNKNKTVKVLSPDCDTDFFDIVVGVLQRDTLAPCLFIICLDNVLRKSIHLMKKNGFTLKKSRNTRYPAWTITDADYADDIALLVNTPTQAESSLHNLDKAAGSIGLLVNAVKTEYMCFNQNKREDIFTLKNGSLKLMNKFTLLESSVSSTENDINTRIAKAWSARDHTEVGPIQ